MSLVGSLLDKCIDFAKARKQARQDLFSNFVQPAFSDFEAVHADYLTAFRRYLDLLEPDSGAGFEQVAKEVARDALFSSNLRLKIYALYPLTLHPILGRFADGLQRYLKCASELDASESAIDGAVSGDSREVYGVVNYPRRLVTNRLTDATRRSDPDLIIRLRLQDDLTKIVAHLQLRHGVIAREYFGLKRQLVG